MNRTELLAAMAATAAMLPEPVDVAGWGTVYIKRLSVGDVTSIASDPDPMTDTHAKGVARILCDETGALLFPPDPATGKIDPEGLAMIKAQPYALLIELVKRSARLNTLTPESQAEAGNA